jgi:hypothetical protein
MLYDVSDEWLDEHGIGREEIEAHGIKRYSKNDVSEVQAEYSTLPQPPQKQYMTRIARQHDGLLIPHHAAPGMGLEHVYAQIRPDKEVFTGESHHHELHDDVRRWAYHLARHPDHGDLDLTDAEVDAMTDEQLREIARTPRLCETPKRDKNGARIKQEIRGDRHHTHYDSGKYIHPPGPMETIEHDHAVDFAGKPKMLASHIEHEHGGEDRAGPHEHRIKNRKVKYATRLDVNPLVTEEVLRDAQRFYFVIEGSIKNLAVLTWVRRRGVNAAVFSVPAVGQWNAPELRDFVERYMVDKPAYIIADSDAHKNSEVMRHALRCRNRLRAWRAQAFILLPGEGWLGLDEKGNPKKVGADDGLGKAKKSLLDFQVIHREVPGWNVIWRAIRKTWPDSTVRVYSEAAKCYVDVTRHTLSNRTWRGRTRDLAVFLALAEQADINSGLYWGSRRAMADDLGIDEKAVRLALEVFIEAGWIQREGGTLEERESEFSFKTVWADKPTLRVVHTEMRPQQTQQRHGDHLQEVEGKENMVAIPTDIEAAAAERVMEAAQELFLMSAQLQARQPTSRVLQETVERFLAAVQESQEFVA